jgi:hypothetical protein
MSDEHPPSQMSSGWPSDTDLFNSVATLRLLSNSNTDVDAGTDTARANPNHQSEYVPEVPKSNSGMFVPTKGVDNNDDAAWDHTSWVPAGLVPPGLAFDDDLSVVSGQKGVDSSFPVHGQKVFPNDTILSNSDAFNQEDACTMSAGAVPRYLNIVSPVAQPNFVNFHELPLGHVLPMGRLISDMTMEAGESSVRRPHLSTCRLQSSKETLWMKNYRDLQVSYRYKSSIIFDPFQVIAHSQISSCCMYAFYRNSRQNMAILTCHKNTARILPWETG